MNNQEIGYRIKARRDELGLTLDDVASKIGVARSTIQRYESGKIEKLKLPVLEAIARVLRVNAGWLLGLDEKRPFSEGEKQPLDGEELSQAQRDLIDLVSRLPEDVCAAMLIALRQQFPPDDPGEK